MGGNLESVGQDDIFGNGFVEDQEADEFDDGQVGRQRDLRFEGVEQGLRSRPFERIGDAAAGAFAADGDCALSADRCEFLFDIGQFFGRQNAGFHCVGHDTGLNCRHAAQGFECDRVAGVFNRVERGDAGHAFAQLEPLRFGDGELDHDPITGVDDKGRRAGADAVARIDVDLFHRSVERRLDRQIVHGVERLLVGDLGQADVLLLLRDCSGGRAGYQFVVTRLRLFERRLRALERQFRF